MIFTQIAGRLGKDPEVRFTPSGQKVTTFNMATNQRKGKEEITIWIRVTVWGDRFDKMISFLKKGSSLWAAGRLNPPSIYTDKEGRPQCSLEMTAEMLEFINTGKDERAEGQSGQSYAESGTSMRGSSQEEAAYSGSFARGSYSNQTLSGQGSHFNSEEEPLPF